MGCFDTAVRKRHQRMAYKVVYIVCVLKHFSLYFAVCMFPWLHYHSMELFRLKYSGQSFGTENSNKDILHNTIIFPSATAK